MDHIDKLLAELKDEYQSQPGEVQPPESGKKTTEISSPTSKNTSKGDAIDRLLNQVKGDFEQKDLAQELQKKQELEQVQIRKEQLKIQQKAAGEKHAQEWLEKLDPLSSEGLWFEKFAQGYTSKLAAAVEYLQVE